MRAQVLTAPDGNGGVYAALARAGRLTDMRARGVEFIDCYSVDNAAARLCDPLFLGAFAASAAPVGARVVVKAAPAERVGVFARCAPSTCSERIYLGKVWQAVLAKHPASPTIGPFLELHMAKSQGIVREWFTTLSVLRYPTTADVWQNHS